MQTERCAEALALSPWRGGWQCTESGRCGANGATYGPKLGIALQAAEAVSSEISADFGDVGRALSYVVRKGICSIKNPNALRLMLSLEALVSPAAQMSLLDIGGLPTLGFLQSLMQGREGPRMLFSSSGVSNSVFCPVVAAGRDGG